MFWPHPHQNIVCIHAAFIRKMNFSKVFNNKKGIFLFIWFTRSPNKLVSVTNNIVNFLTQLLFWLYAHLFFFWRSGHAKRKWWLCCPQKTNGREIAFHPTLNIYCVCIWQNNTNIYRLLWKYIILMFFIHWTAFLWFLVLSFETWPFKHYQMPS